jgi:hypothetical protein
VASSTFLSLSFFSHGRSIEREDRYTYVLTYNWHSAPSALAPYRVVSRDPSILLGLNRRCLSFSAAEHDNKSRLKLHTDCVQWPWKRVAKPMNGFRPFQISQSVFSDRTASFRCPARRVQQTALSGTVTYL